MLTAISSALTELLTMIGSVIFALTGTSGALNALLPVFAIGIAIALVGWVVSLIRRLAWGA